MSHPDFFVQMCFCQRLNIPRTLAKFVSGANADDSKHFFKRSQINVRKNSNALQMTSYSSNEQHPAAFMPAFKVQGEKFYHTIGSLLPLDGQEPTLSKIYLVGDWQTMLHGCSPYNMSVRTVLDVGNMPNMRVKINADRTPCGEHHRRFNTPYYRQSSCFTVG